MVVEPLNPGDMFRGKFRIDERLGEGGFALVYGATDLALQRKVAVKLLKPDGANGYNPDTEARFRREIQAVARLQCPHTVTMYEHGTTDTGVRYIVFEHVPGEDLDKVLARGNLPADVTEHILRQLLESLREAHFHDVIHRDIKPENVRVTPSREDRWRVKLFDFGIARQARADAPSVTGTGELIGTPRYMSPEQLTDRPLTPASDIYSLGIVALELLIGRQNLHGGSWGDQFDRLQSGYLFSAPGVDHDAARLMAVIRGMTARGADERLPNADAVLSMLDGGKPAAAPLESRRPEVERPAEPPRTSIRWLPAAAVAAVFALAAAVVLLTSEQPTPPVAITLPAAGTVARPSIVATPPPDAGAEPNRVAPAVSRAKGCGTVQDEGTQTLKWSYLLRRSEALVHIPKGYDPDRPYPIVAMFHDARQHPRTMLDESGMTEIADREGIILVIMEGDLTDAIKREGTAFVRRKRLKPWNHERINEAQQILNTIDTALCVDIEKVFLVGQGRGSKAARALACTGGIAAIATISYRSKDGRDELCEVPRLFLSPTGDERNPVDGVRKPGCEGADSLSLAAQETILVEQHRCSGESSVTEDLPNGQCESHSCDTPLWTCRIDGGIHWPLDDDRRPCGSAPASDFPTSRVVWDFFSSIVVPLRRGNDDLGE